MGDLIDDGYKKVGLVDVLLALQDDHCPFKAHAGIDARSRQGRPFAGGVLEVLHEHQVPQLHIPFAITVGVAAVDGQRLSRLQLFTELSGQLIRFDHPAAVAAFISATVIMDFRTGSGGSFIAGRAPPVVFVAVAVDVWLRNSDLVTPDGKGLFVVQMDGHVETFRFQLEKLGDQLPAVAHRPFFEVVSNAEVAQHLKEGQVLVVADLVNVVGPKAFLAAGESFGGRGLLAHEKGLERNHASAGEKQGWVSGWNQRSGGHVLVPFAFKKLDE